MMLSRVADDLYWTARYLERAANMMRFLDVSYILDLDRPEGGVSQWEPLAWISGDMPLFRTRYGEATRENVMHFLTMDAEYPNSVVSCLEKARTNAKGLREQVSVALWEEINSQWQMTERFHQERGFSHTRILTLCREVNRIHTLILGLVSETMARGDRYNFWQLGTFIERADKTSRMLHVKYFHLLPRLSDVGTIIDDAQWSALLQSLNAREDYHRQYGLITPAQVIDMIVRNPLFARSMRFCLDEVRRSLTALAFNPASGPLPPLDALRTRIQGLTAEEIIRLGVHEFINAFQIQLNQISNAIVDAVFCPTPWTPPTFEKEETSQ